jgi:hypothetical protein
MTWFTKDTGNDCTCTLQFRFDIDEGLGSHSEEVKNLATQYRFS